GESAARFVSLAGYTSFFDDMMGGFVMLPTYAAGSPKGFSLPSFPRPKLVVHTVGAFEASYVPSIDDFDRLDERFRLPTEVWQHLPEYADYGFAVFKLRKARRSRVHPMAFRFVTRNPAALFFPTVHIHDGKVHEAADFDHELYFQGGAREGANLSWGNAEQF